MILRNSIAFCRVEIVYRIPRPLPLRFEARPGVWATLALEVNKYVQQRVELVARTDRDPRSVAVKDWPDMETAEFCCRHGFTLDYRSLWPGVFRPAVRARLMEVVIGPHTRIPYASIAVEERCWWPVPKPPRRHTLYGPQPNFPKA